jgi:light-regulated signal transduction histidine kinase (bacteriophytochrome)
MIELSPKKNRWRSSVSDLEEFQRATFNILEDFNVEKTRLEESQKATLNILEDFNDEKEKVIAAYKKLKGEVEQRKQAEESLRRAHDELEVRVCERTQELSMANDELDRSNKDLEQFAYVASHDLQEPIRKIVGFAQLFAGNFEGQLEGKQKEYLDYVIDGAKRMQALIQDLLAYSRIGRKELTVEPLDFNEVVKEAVGNLELVVKETKAEIICRHLPCLSGHRSFIVQIFQNLIGNSLKYRSKKIPRIEISAQQKNDRWEFTVADNGIGIDFQFASKLFMIFQRLHTKDKYEGTGIGLAVSKRMVERHGGRIWLEPREHDGGGAVFKFTLPNHAA